MTKRKTVNERRAPIVVPQRLQDAIVAHLFEIEDLPPRGVNSEITYRVRGDQWTVEVVKVEHHPITQPKERA